MLLFVGSSCFSVSLLWFHSFRVDQDPSPHHPPLWQQEIHCQLTMPETYSDPVPTRSSPLPLTHPCYRTMSMSRSGGPRTLWTTRNVGCLPRKKLWEEERGNWPLLRGESDRVLCLSLRLEERGGGKRRKRRSSSRTTSDREESNRIQRSTWTRGKDRTRIARRAGPSPEVRTSKDPFDHMHCHTVWRFYSCTFKHNII